MIDKDDNDKIELTITKIIEMRFVVDLVLDIPTKILNTTCLRVGDKICVNLKDNGKIESIELISEFTE